MESLVSSYFAEYKDKEVKFSSKQLVKLLADRFYFRVLHTHMYSFSPDFMRYIDKDSKSGYVRLTYSTNSLRNCKYDSFQKTVKDLISDLDQRVIDVTPDDFQTWFLEELKSYIDREDGITLVSEESVVQNPYDNSDDGSYIIQLTLDVDLPNLETDEEQQGGELDGEKTVE